MGCARCRRSTIPSAVPTKTARAYSGLPLCMHCYRAVVSMSDKDQQQHEDALP